MSILGILALLILLAAFLESGAFVLIPFFLLGVCVFFLVLLCLTYPWVTPVVLLVLFWEFRHNHAQNERRPKPEQAAKFTSKIQTSEPVKASKAAPAAPPLWSITVNVLVIVPLMFGLLGMIEDIPFMTGWIGTFIIAALVFGPLYLANRFELLYRKIAAAVRGKRTSPEPTPGIRNTPRRRKSRAAAGRINRE